MPSRLLVAKHLAEIFKVVAHQDRIRLIEDLRGVERDVTSLAEALDLPGPRVSQHLSLLRAHKIVDERRDGRRHMYRLNQPEIAAWIVDGVNFVESRVTGAQIANDEIEQARRAWQKENSLSEGNTE